MIITKATFLKSCPRMALFPKYQYPECAFFGRSNVGKSSLINMIAGIRDLVKTGSRPGVTQAVNFFVINEALSFADLPGFGYAKVPEEIKKKFRPLIMDYIKERENLKLAFLLIDIRRVPDHHEHEIMALLAQKRVPTVITLTKCDKLSKNQRTKAVAEIKAALDIEIDSMFFTSTKTGEGKKEMLQLIEDFLR